MEEHIPQEALRQFGPALETAYHLAMAAFASVDTDPVNTPHDYATLKALWPQQLPASGLPAGQVVEELARSATPGLNLNQSGRFFAWVIGGAHPAALGADWLTSAWDQNAGAYACTPASLIAEEIAGEWLKELLGLPHQSAFAFVTGGQMANFTCLAAGRNHLFQLLGWDFEARGFYGAPKIRVIAGDQKHSTVTRALRMLGFGSENLIEVPTDDQARIIPESLEDVLRQDPEVPALITLQAGEIHSGSFDDFGRLVPMIRRYPAWIHIDGAFGLWAAACPEKRHFMEGAAWADSWATDGHKWLNVPYDSGYAFVAQPEALFRSFSQHADYIRQADTGRDANHWNPELSRRARGFATYAAIRELGREGIADLVRRNSAFARDIVLGAASLPGVEVLAEPIINQGVVAFRHPDPGATQAQHDAFTEQVVTAINATGKAFFQPSTFRGRRCMRISVSGWRTTPKDVDITLRAIGIGLGKAWVAAEAN